MPNLENPAAVLAFLAQGAPAADQMLVDTPRLRAHAAYSAALLRAIELVDIEARLLRLEAAAKDGPA